MRALSIEKYGIICSVCPVFVLCVTLFMPTGDETYQSQVAEISTRK